MLHQIVTLCSGYPPC